VIDGIAVIDKPAGMTSHDVVARIRKVLKTRKVGHAGTLDPMATGVLVIGIGRATRLLGFLTGSTKTYRTTLRLGFATTTDDAEGEVTSVASDISNLTREAIVAGVTELTGSIEQVPSSVSAIKVGGRRAHALLRAGEQVTLAPRPVTIHRFDVGNIVWGSDVVDVEATVECSAGTYVRALARDLGAILGVGGHVATLRRVKSGHFDQAQTLDEFDVSPRIVPMGTAIQGEMQIITVEDVDAVAHGRQLPGEIQGDLAALVDSRGELLAIVEPDNGLMRYRAVFAAAGAS
jgi:tRNA pseudouridine55 synthase